MVTPAALVDINNDSVADIVIATFNRYWLIIFVDIVKMLRNYFLEASKFFIDLIAIQSTVRS